MIELWINDQRREVDEGLSLADLVGQLQLKPQQVAIEVNQQLVPRERHPRLRLQPGDRLEVVTLAGGG